MFQRSPSLPNLKIPNLKNPNLKFRFSSWSKNSKSENFFFIKNKKANFYKDISLSCFNKKSKLLQWHFSFFAFGKKWNWPFCESSRSENFKSENSRFENSGFYISTLTHFLVFHRSLPLLNWKIQICRVCKIFAGCAKNLQGMQKLCLVCKKWCRVWKWSF